MSTRQQDADRQVFDLPDAGVRRDDLDVDPGVSGGRASRAQSDKAVDALGDVDGEPVPADPGTSRTGRLRDARRRIRSSAEVGPIGGADTRIWSTGLHPVPVQQGGHCLRGVSAPPRQRTSAEPRPRWSSPSRPPTRVATDSQFRRQAKAWREPGSGSLMLPTLCRGDDMSRAGPGRWGARDPRRTGISAS
ncbi:hypothetical protein ACH9D2_03005 [Kocuria sp. M4R2S49]|uniref:hypothetical protein n=1 Tax=Kocuria rhizosphaericola TaxID=3376284 RepID=UPI0037B3FF59